MPTSRIKAALQKQWARREEERWLYGTMGRKNPDGSYTFIVPGRSRFVYVTLRNAIGAQTVVPARNDVGVEHGPNIGVRMLYEKNNYVIYSKSTTQTQSVNEPTPPTGVPVHNHDERYFREDEYTSSSFGASSAGLPVVLDNTGQLDSSFVPLHDMIDGSTEDDTPDNTAKFPYTHGGGIWHIPWADIVSTIGTALGVTTEAIQDMISTFLVGGNGISFTYDDGANTLTAALTTLTSDWDIGEDRAILLEFIKARDNEGVSIRDDGNNPGLTVLDGGYVQAGAVNSSLVESLSVSGIDSNTSSLAFARYSNNNGPPVMRFYKSRNGSVGSHTVVQADDSVGIIAFLGSDGTDFESAAWIQALIDGTPGNNDMPGRLVFLTTPDGGVTPLERMRIDKDGNIAIGTTSIASNTRLHVHNASAVSRLRIETGAAADASIFIITPSGGTIVGNTGSAGGILTGTGAADFAISARAGGAIRISADTGFDSAEGINLLENGFLGVGIATPNTRLGIRAGSSTNDAAVGGVLFVSTSQVGNVGAGDDTLHSYSLPANSLQTNNQSIQIRAFGSASAGKTIRVKFGATTIAALTTAAAGEWIIEAFVFRTGATTQKCFARIHNTGGGTYDAHVNYVTAAETLSGAVTIAITGEGTSNNDVVCEMSIIEWKDANT